jgi:hypothetical protein
MKKLLLIALFASCQTPKSDEVKIREMDEQFEKSMEQDTYCYFDTLQKLQAEDVCITVQCLYDTINGLRK